jgi:esterase/lipase superfamily enzyme
MVVPFTWPSDGSKLPWAYKNDRDDAVDSGKAFGRGVLKLRDFLSDLMKKAKKGEDQLCKQEIHLICHSMGNYVLQNTLTKLIEHHNEHHEGYPLRIFKNIFLCAPDIDEDVLEPDKPMERLHEICKNATVYYNTGDVAMYFSDYTKGNPDRLGNAGAARPQVLHNRIHQVDCSFIVSGPVEHSYYLWDIVSDDIRYSIEGKAFDDAVRNRKRKEGNTWLLQK